MQAAGFGSPELAHEAALSLDETFGPRVGQLPSGAAFVGPADWTAEDGVGRGTFRWAGLEWDMFDYGDTLTLEPDLAD
eukprot:5000304-Heterocapsa_arctica.AAC.1